MSTHARARTTLVGLAALALGPLATMVATVAPAAAQTPPPAATVGTSTGGLELVGRSDLGGGGLNGDVAVVGTTAVVAAGQMASGAFVAGFASPIPCPDVAVKIVDLSDATRPRVASTIPLPPGVVAADVDALSVRTPSFTGDLAAVALSNTACSGPALPIAERGVAFYDVTNPAAPGFLGRYQANADNVAPGTPPCSPTAGAACAANQWSVSLAQRPDGRVVSLSVFRGGTTLPSGDLRVVDVTNPRAPTQVGSALGLDDRPPGPFNNGFSSSNGCRSFFSGYSATAYRDGTRAALSYLDEGLYNLDLANPASPRTLGRFTYPNQRGVEGGAAHTAVAEVGGRSLGLLSESDLNAPATSLRIDGPSPLAGSKFGCEAVFTLLDPKGAAPIYRRPGAQVPGEIVFVGRGCPVAGSVTVADPYLANPAGKIALVDRNPTVQTGLTGICSFSDRVGRAQASGALGVVFADTATTPSFSPDGDPTGLSIPAIIIEKADADALRTSLCPAPLVAGACAGGQIARGAMVDSQGEWGGLRVLDLTNPGAPTPRGLFQTARSRAFPPPDAGVYSVAQSVTRGSMAYAAWNSDGLRVLDLSTDTPTEVASFVPPDTIDPSRSGVLPPKALVTGVALGSDTVVISDVNSGLYVLQFGQGYWTVGSDGGIFAFGDAPFAGSTGALRLNQPIVGMAPTPTRRGYWTVAADGGVFAFGDARFFGSTGALRLNRPIVGMAPTPSGQGYFLVASDGGIFAFGDAVFRGSTGALTLNRPVVGMAADPATGGYWLVASDGGLFAYDAPFDGSMGGRPLNKPVVGMSSTPTGKGYWLVASDGGIFAFGDARFFGSTGAIALNQPVVGIAAGR
ncbi:MAG: PA domain-containing protein [Acidimicrobiales bacterium]